MFIKDWKKEILTIPNLLSLFRLALIPVYLNIYLHAQTDAAYLLAGSILALSCLTDLADGKIARQFQMVSQVGKVLDPLADKLTQLSLIGCLSARYPVLYPILALFITKELFQLTVMIVHLRRGKALNGALMAGKLCTAVLFVSLIALVLFPRMHPKAVDILVILDGAFLLNSFFSYALAYFGKNKKVQDLP